MNKMICALVSVMLVSGSVAGQRMMVPIQGRVTDANSGAPLIGANIAVMSTLIGTASDTHGYYLLHVQAGTYRISFSSVGYKTVIKDVRITDTDTKVSLNASLDSSIYSMNDVTVRATRVSGNQPLDTLKARDLLNIPNLFSNVLSSIKILPGVTSNSELSSAYNVRGGNFDENLLYLNGFEIAQPLLLRQGIEQSQSIINENMVSSMEFHHGAFPVHFGDKMSSALAVNYYTEESPDLGGEVHADLFSMGLTLHEKTGDLNWRIGVRHAYPSLFDKTLQTSGVYKPRYDDIQVQASYALPHNSLLQLLLITGKNTFESTPQSWFGNYQSSYLMVHQVALKFAGTSNYDCSANLLGLKLITPIDDHSRLTTSLSYSSDKEAYNTQLAYTVAYASNVYYQPENVKSLGTGSQFADNSIAARKFELQSEYSAAVAEHTINAAVDLRYSRLESQLNESASYTGTDSVLHTTREALQRLDARFNALSGYIEDNIALTRTLSVNAGVRLLKYYFNGELLVSPRADLSFTPSAVHSLTLSWGVYYQPPFFYETWDKSLSTATSLRAQRNIQSNLGWTYAFKERSRFTTELFYKDLSRLLPYAMDQLQLTYGDKNDHEGYAYGMDLQYEGEVVRGMQTWIGYSYLNAKERETSVNSRYAPSPLDQTHTVRIFLQDHAESHPNFQAHVLLLIGTGYHYHPMMTIAGSSPGSYEIVPDYSVTEEYPFYFRVDMGLTFEFALFETRKMTLKAEVLNVFDKNNVTSYSWFQVYPGLGGSAPVPNILSPRFFNVGFKLEL